MKNKRTNKQTNKRTNEQTGTCSDSVVKGFGGGSTAEHCRPLSQQRLPFVNHLLVAANQLIALPHEDGGLGSLVRKRFGDPLLHLPHEIGGLAALASDGVLDRLTHSANDCVGGGSLLLERIVHELPSCFSHLTQFLAERVRPHGGFDSCARASDRTTACVTGGGFTTQPHPAKLIRRRCELGPDLLKLGCASVGVGRRGWHLSTFRRGPFRFEPRRRRVAALSFIIIAQQRHCFVEKVHVFSVGRCEVGGDGERGVQIGDSVLELGDLTPQRGDFVLVVVEHRLRC
jgi:hypothetical protein